jgi:hypothetical protein
MRKALLAIAVALFFSSLAHAQTDVLIEIDTGERKDFSQNPPCSSGRSLWRRSPAFLPGA